MAKIYADHAATTQLDPEALAAMMPFLTEEYGNASQLYSLARRPRKALQEARKIIADCIGAEPEEIYFTSGGTESDNWAIKETLLAQRAGTIVTSCIEHHAVLHSCNAVGKLGYNVLQMPAQTDGSVDADWLTKHFPEDCRLVSVMYANNEIGTIQPIRDLARLARDHGVLFHTDAVQAVGHVPIDVGDLGVDLLSASAHKFNGPKGVGFLYIRKGTAMTPYADGGGQENGMRAGTENVAGIVGMATALRKNCESMQEHEEHLMKLEERLLARLREYQLDFLRNGGTGAHIPGNVSLSFREMEGEMMLHRLDLMGICVSTGSACNSTTTELSHVIRAIDVPKDYAYGTIRVSLGHENTEADVDAIAAALKTIGGHTVDPGVR